MMAAAAVRPLGRLLTLVGLALVLASVSAVAGTAATAPVSGTCPGTPTFPFAPWGDGHAYLPAPGGGFEPAAGWTLAGGASVVPGNEPFFVRSRLDSQALRLPAGSSATTPPVCTTLDSPTIRLFVQGGDPGSALRVDVIATTPAGRVTKQVGLVSPSLEWAPTAAIRYLTNVFAVLNPGGTTTVQFRFTPVGPGTWRIDDLYVDPWKLT